MIQQGSTLARRVENRRGSRAGTEALIFRSGVYPRFDAEEPLWIWLFGYGLDLLSANLDE